MVERTVYMVTTGNYSNYQVLAIFSSQALAERYVASRGNTGPWNDGCEIDSMPLDPMADALWAKRLPYSVRINRDGNNARASLIEDDAGDRGHDEPQLFWPEARHSDVRSAEPRAWGRFVVTAKDPEHAVKIANERRAMMIASDRWPESDPATGTHQRVVWVRKAGV